MTNDNSEWLRHFLQAGLFQEPQLQNPAHDAPAPSSGYHQDMVFGVPSSYQALMSMTNNNPSHYFQQQPYPGHGLTPEQAERVAMAALQRDHAQSAPYPPHPTSTLQRPPVTATVAPSALLKYPQPPMTLSEPTQQHPDPQVQSTRQLPHPFSSAPRPAMPASVTSSERQTLSQNQQPRNSLAVANHGAGNITRPASRPDHRTLQRSSMTTFSRQMNTSQPSRASPVRVNQQVDYQAQSVQQERSSSQPSRAPPAPVRQPPGYQVRPTQPGRIVSSQPSSASPVPANQHPGHQTRPTQQGQIVSSQPSSASPAPATQHPGNQTRPAQQHIPVEQRRTPLETAHPAGQTPSQPPRASSADQHGNKPTHSAPKPATVSTLRRPPMAAPSGRLNASQSPMARPSPGQQNPDDADHVTKKRRMDDGSSEARPRPTWQQSKTIPRPGLKSVLPPQPPQPPQPKSAPQPQFKSVSQQGKAPTPGNLSAFSYSLPHKNALRDRMEMSSMFSSLDAAEKAEYDPRTIARDVLIASGRHPTEPRLNNHLFRLRDLFNGVTNLADLTTFRWDLAEAAAREQEAVASSRPPPPQQSQQQQPQTQPQSTIRRPTPQLKPLNSIGRPPWQTNNLHSQRPPANSANPSRSQPPLGCFPAETPVSTAPNHAPAARLPQQAPAGSTPKPTPAISLPKHTPPIDLAKRTPPAGSSMQTPAVQAPRQTPTANKHQRAVAVSIPKQKAAANGPKPAVAVNIPKRTTPQSQAPKMVGKKQQAMVEVSIPAVSVSYPVFACKWKGCHAKLHNLDVLKQHLTKIHIPHHITCEWDECQLEGGLPAVKLYKHIMKQHVEPIAWKLGDGPTVRKTVGSDDNGRPWRLARPDPSQMGGEDSLIFPASDTSILAFTDIHEKTSRTQKAEEIFKAIQRLKERIGVGMDPGGCQLATPERNARVSNDEEVYELVPQETEAS